METALQKYIPMFHVKDYSLIGAIQDNYTGHVRDFTKWLSNNQLVKFEDSVTEYFRQLNQNKDYSANTIRIKRQSVKKRLEQMTMNKSLDEKTKVYTFLKDLDKQPDTRAPKINSVEVSRDMYLRPDEVRELINKCRTARQKLFIRFLFATGSRVAEMCSIKLLDCKTSESIVKIRIMGKGRKERFLRISSQLFKDIKKEFKGKEFLFETSGGVKTLTVYASGEVRKIGKLIKKKISAHTMRHSWAMAMIDRYPSKLDAISKYLGHSNPSITLAMYCHNQMEDEELLSMELEL